MEDEETVQPSQESRSVTFEGKCEGNLHKVGRSRVILTLKLGFGLMFIESNEVG